MSMVDSDKAAGRIELAVSGCEGIHPAAALDIARCDGATGEG
jgi:hypothetical protein